MLAETKQNVAMTEAEFNELALGYDIETTEQPDGWLTESIVDEDGFRIAIASRHTHKGANFMRLSDPVKDRFDAAGDLIGSEYKSGRITFE